MRILVYNKKKTKEVNIVEKARILENLIKEQGFNLKSFAAKCGIPYTTLYGIIKNGVGKASVDNIIIICKNLGITVESLEDMAKGGSQNQYEPSYDDMEQLIARNGNKLTTKEKMKLIKLLSEID